MRRLRLFFLKSLLLCGALLVVFALCHHVVPAWVHSRSDEFPEAAPPAPSQISTSSASPGPVSPEALGAPEETDGEKSSAVPEEDSRTPWQIRFADRFTEGVEISDDSYTSPTVSVNIETVSTEADGDPLVYYVADIYLADIHSFATYLAGGSYSDYKKATVQEMSREAGAILAVNGDFYNSHKYATMVRNGEWFRDWTTYWDVCVLYEDGTMETLLADSYSVDALKEKPVWQLWCFGPALLDGEGNPSESFNMSDSVVNAKHPRCGIGYYEPGHYCFVMVDGRDHTWSKGVTVAEFAQVFADLGCRVAYNLDGGGSAAMAFRQELYSHPSNGDRDIADILYICEPEEAK